MPQHCYEELWSKDNGEGYYPLLPHLLDVAAIAGQLFDIWLRPGLREQITQALGNKARAQVCWLAGIHDIGKANPVFQGQLAADEHHTAEHRHYWASVRDRIRTAGNCSFPREAADVRRLVDSYEMRRHEVVSALYLLRWKLENPYTVETWQAVPALGHHGYFAYPFIDGSYSRNARQDFRELLEQHGWIKAQQRLAAHVATAVGLTVDAQWGAPKELAVECPAHIAVLISGLAILADRLASHQEWVERTRQAWHTGAISLASAREWVQYQMPYAAEAIADSLGGPIGWPSPEAAREDILGQWPLRPVQEVALHGEDGLQVFMVPTGTGKTEAAFLRHSTAPERLAFFLPTMATSSAMMKRTQFALRNQRATASLAHSLASIEDFYTEKLSVNKTHRLDRTHRSDTSDDGGLIPTDFVQHGVSRLLAAVTVGTVDQALKSAMPIRWVHLLLLGLANAHVVIDEVHTMDPYQTELLEELLGWLGRVNSRVTLLTATFPSDLFNRLMKAYSPSIGARELTFPSVVSSNGHEELISVQPYEVDYTLIFAAEGQVVLAHLKQVAELRAAYPQARIGVMCNQVARVQQVAEALEKAGHEVVVLHSRMTAQHRSLVAARLEELIGPAGNARGITVVGTQAIEASLDIDFDILCTDLCPSASLLQRAGRVWRHVDPHRQERVPDLMRPTLRIVIPHNFEGADRYPYFSALLQRTKAWLVEHHGPIAIPEDCQDLVDSCVITMADIRDEFDLDYLAESGIKRTVAQGRKIKFGYVLDEDGYLEDFCDLTVDPRESKAPDDIFPTRLLDVETDRVLVVDASGSTPGALTESELAAFNPAEISHDTVRRYLRASVVLPKHILSREPYTQLQSQLPPSRSVLSNMAILDVSGYYSPLWGLEIPKEETGDDHSDFGLSEAQKEL